MQFAFHRLFYYYKLILLAWRVPYPWLRGVCDYLLCLGTVKHATVMFRPSYLGRTTGWSWREWRKTKMTCRVAATGGHLHVFVSPIASCSPSSFHPIYSSPFTCTTKPVRAAYLTLAVRPYKDWFLDKLDLISIKFSLHTCFVQI